MVHNNKGISEYTLPSLLEVINPPKSFCIYPEDARKFDGQVLYLEMYHRGYTFTFRHILSPNGTIYYRVTLTRLDRLSDTRIVEFTDNEYLLVTVGNYRMSIVKPIIPLHQYEYIPWAIGLSRGSGHRRKYIMETFLQKYPDAERYEYLNFIMYRTKNGKYIYDIDSCDNKHITTIIKILKYIMRTNQFIIPGVTSHERLKFMLDYCTRKANTM